MKVGLATGFSLPRKNVWHTPVCILEELKFVGLCVMAQECVQYFPYSLGYVQNK